MWPFRRDPTKWELIGTNRNIDGIPRWVMSAFAHMPGSQGTLLIEHPDPGHRIYLKGRTYRYRIDLGNQAWSVYRKRRRSPK